MRAGVIHCDLQDQQRQGATGLTDHSHAHAHFYAHIYMYMLLFCEATAVRVQGRGRVLFVLGGRGRGRGGYENPHGFCNSPTQPMQAVLQLLCWKSMVSSLIPHEPMAPFWGGVLSLLHQLL